MTKVPSAKDRKQAQEYAKAALSGSMKYGSGYVSPSQVDNAVANAGTAEPEKPETAGDVAAAPASVYDPAAEYYAQQQKMMDAQYKRGKRNINKAAADGNKEAYIAYMNGLKTMPQKAAIYGSGGYAQSLLNKSQLNYENNRNSIEQQRQASLADLEADYRNGILNAQNDYLTRLQSSIGKATATKAVPARSTNAKSTAVAAGDGDDATVDEASQVYRRYAAMGWSKDQIEKVLRDKGYLNY